MNPSLAEYNVPVHMDVPAIEVIWNDIPDPHSPLGARGIGEIGITGVGAAVANAVYNATGQRIRELPITLDKLQKGAAHGQCLRCDVRASDARVSSPSFCEAS
jgi:xanthine dehydrogenase YagR molybdenum-binding subunit